MFREFNEFFITKQIEKPWQLTLFFCKALNPLTPMSDQDSISLQYHNNIKQTYDENKEK